MWHLYGLAAAAGVTPVDTATSSIVGYILGYGPIGIIALALAWLTWKGWRLWSPAREDKIRATIREEARADLAAELERTRADKTAAEARNQALQQFATDQLVPLLTTFTATTSALIPLLQQLVTSQEGRRR